MIIMTTKSKTKSKDTPKGKTEKESIPKEPLIIEPLYDGEEYPRIEVTVDGVSATVGTRMSEDEPLTHRGFCSPNVRSILQLIDQKMMHEKMIAKRGDDFEDTLKGFIKMVKQHNTQIMKLAGVVEDVV